MRKTSLPIAGALLGCVLSAPSLAQSQIFEFVGEDLEDRLGRSVRSAGDVNADGVPDIVVGIYQDGTNGLHAGSVVVYSGLTGTVLHEWFGDQPDDQLGVSAAGLGDIDGDGYGEVLVGAYEAGGAGTGYARVFSGQTGATLYTFFGAQVGDTFGEWVSRGGDINNDGVEDMLVGADDTNNCTGLLYVFSGLDGSLIRTHPGQQPGDNFSVSAAPLGDIDGDGFDDYLTGSYLSDETALSAGSAYVYSGQTGATIRVHYGANAGDGFGFNVAGLGDLDDDGIRDYAIGIPGTDQLGTDTGSVNVYSGDEGILLYTLVGPTKLAEFGFAVSGIGDIDGDGKEDIAVGGPKSELGGFNAGLVRVFSGDDGSVLYTLLGDSPGDRYGTAVAGVGDLNQDGMPDFMIGAHRSSPGGFERGKARLVSGQLLNLTTDRHTISLAGGGIQTMALEATPAYAGMLYLGLGSGTGTTPGLNLAGGTVHLPLNFDSYMQFTIQIPNQLGFKSSVGFLDAQGSGSMRFELPAASDPGLSGLTLNHAFLVYQLGPTKPVFGSNAVPMTFVP